MITILAIKAPEHNITSFSFLPGSLLGVLPWQPSLLMAWKLHFCSAALFSLPNTTATYSLWSIAHVGNRLKPLISFFKTVFSLTKSTTTYILQNIAHVFEKNLSSLSLFNHGYTYIHTYMI